MGLGVGCMSLGRAAAGAGSLVAGMTFRPAATPGDGRMTLGPAAAAAGAAAGPELRPGIPGIGAIPGVPGAAAPGVRGRDAERDLGGVFVRDVLPPGVSTPDRPLASSKARCIVSLMAASSKTDLGCNVLATSYI